MKIVGHSSVETFLRYRTAKTEKFDAATRRLDAALHYNKHASNWR